MIDRRLPKAFVQRGACTLLILSFLGGAVAWAADPPASSGAMREIFVLSGLRPQLETMGLQLDELISAQTDYPPEALDLLRREVARHYSPGALETAIVPRMRALEDPALAASTLSWLRSPLGSKVTGLDSSASSAEAGVAMHHYVEELELNPAPPERLAIVDRIISATHYTEARTDMGLSIMEMLILALNATYPEDGRSDPVDVREKIESTRADTLVESRELSRAAMLYTYRSLANSELEKLLAFAESAAGRWYYATLWRSAADALNVIAFESYADMLREVQALSASQQP